MAPVASVVSAPLSSVDLQAIQKRLCSLEARLTQMTSSTKVGSQMNANYDKCQTRQKFVGKCHYCSKVGHKMNKCWKLKRDLAEKDQKSESKNNSLK